MRKAAGLLGAALLAIIPITGCYDRIDMEKASLSLVSGIDIDGQHRAVHYTSIPVFNKAASRKSLELKVVEETQRQGRGYFDAYTTGSFNSRKVKAVVVSKRFTQEIPDWFRYMDVFFRDGRNPITSRMLIFDGPLDQLFNFHSPGEPILPLMLMGMLESTSGRSESVKTTLQEFHRQMNEEGQTPALPEVAIDQDAKIKGTALLDHHGRYIDTLSTQETILMRILQKSAGQGINFSLRLPPELTGATNKEDWISIATERVKVRIDPSYKDGRFRFAVGVRISASVVEKLSSLDLDEFNRQAEVACAKQIRDKLTNLLDKLKQDKIDPVGFGIYARAYHHRAFEQVKQNWGEAFGRSDVQVRVSVSFADEGSVK